jgi:hypothetical protein
VPAEFSITFAGVASEPIPCRKYGFQLGINGLHSTIASKRVRNTAGFFLTKRCELQPVGLLSKEFGKLVRNSSEETGRTKTQATFQKRP